MATGHITIDEGTTTQLPTYSISEDAATKQLARTVINNSSGTEIAIATSTLQSTGNTSLATIATNLPAQGQALAAASLPVVLTAAQITTLTPPAAITGFATAAKQPALGTAGTASADVITVQGIASMTALKVDGSAVTQPVSGTVTTTPPSNASTNIAQINGVVPLMGNGATGTGSLRTTVASDNTGVANWGHGAMAATIPTGGTATGVLGRTTLPSSVASGQMVNQLADRYGRTYVLSPVLTTKSSNGTAITTNTNTSIVAAPSAGNHLRIHRLWAQNSSATGTWCYWGNGSGDKTVGPPFFLAQYQPFSMDIKGAWELSTATALFMNTATTGANIEWYVEYETLAD